tara:strand:- start:1258 stop:1917 length:660 start_codon:yes stop_codon:yes gene_type:complete
MSSETEILLEVLKTEIFPAYVNCGSRSSKKVQILHNHFKKCIDNLIHLKSLEDVYSCKLEYDVPSVNSKGSKKCDIVILKTGRPYIVFPVKFIMSNYYQNRNNYWENQTGEIMHMVWENSNLIIIPINLIFNEVPYLSSENKIKNFETITYRKTFKIYDILITNNIIEDVINIIVDVAHECEVGDIYDKCPNILGINQYTPYRTFEEILSRLLSINGNL